MTDFHGVQTRQFAFQRTEAAKDRYEALADAYWRIRKIYYHEGWVRVAYERYSLPVQTSCSVDAITEARRNAEQALRALHAQIASFRALLDPEAARLVYATIDQEVPDVRPGDPDAIMLDDVPTGRQ